MAEWLMIVTIFGETVLQLGPYPAPVCDAVEARAIAEIERRAASGRTFHHQGRAVTRADVEVGCRKAAR